MKLTHLYLPPGIRVVITLGDLLPQERHPDGPPNEMHDPVRIEVFEKGEFVGQLEMPRDTIDGSAPEEFIELLLEKHQRPGPRLVE